MSETRLWFESINMWKTGWLDDGPPDQSGIRARYRLVDDPENPWPRLLDSADPEPLELDGQVQEAGGLNRNI